MGLHIEIRCSSDELGHELAQAHDGLLGRQVSVTVIAACLCPGMSLRELANEVVRKVESAITGLPLAGPPGQELDWPKNRFSQG